MRSCEYNYLAEDMAVSFFSDDLPIYDYPSYIESGICGVCMSGSAEVDVFNNRQRIVKNDFVVIFPNQLVSLTERSSDFSMTFFRVSNSFFRDIMSGICKMTIDFFFFMRGNFIRSITDVEVKGFNRYCKTLSMRAESETFSGKYRRETILYWLRVVYWDLYVYYQQNRDSGAGKYSYTRQEELAMDFFNLLAENYKYKRDVAFYADKMCITPKYLTMAVKEVCGKSAKDIIIEYTMLELKALLRDSSLDIKDVVTRTNFPTQSIMSRFFRKHAGMSPTEYRLKTGK